MSLSSLQEMTLKEFDHFRLSFWYLLADVDMQRALNTECVELLLNDSTHFRMVHGPVGERILFTCLPRPSVHAAWGIGSSPVE